MKMPKFKAPTIAPQFNPTVEFDKAKQKVVSGLGSPAKTLSEGYVGLRDQLSGKHKRDIDKSQKEARAAIEAQRAHAQMLRDLPQLQDRQGLASIGEAGQFKATTLDNPDVSPWQQMAMQQQGVKQGIAGDEFARSNAIAAAQGRASLAGGRGAANSGLERFGQNNMLSLAAGKQDLATIGGQQRQAIAQQAAGKGLGIAQFNAGQLNQADQANVSAQRADAAQQNAFNQVKYGEQMKFKSGQQTGNATAKSGGKK